MRQPTRVFIVDDHVILCQGLVALLESYPDIQVVGHATGGWGVEDEILRACPDVVVTDMVMPQLSGADLIARLRERAGDRIRVVILSMYTSPEYVHRAIKMGACGYVSKDAPAAELVDIILHATNTNPRFSQTVAESIGNLEELQVGFVRSDENSSRLSPREIEVLRLIAEGCRNKEIADRLCISLKTVEAHKTSLMRKLGTRNYSALIRHAVSLGLAPPLS